jgi:hypothetical protein
VAGRGGPRTQVDGLAGAAGRVQLIVGGACALVAAGRVGADGVRRGAEVRVRIAAFVHILTVGSVTLKIKFFKY